VQTTSVIEDNGSSSSGGSISAANRRLLSGWKTKTFTTPTLPGTVVAYNFNESDNIISNVAANVNIKGNTALSFGTALALGESTLTKVRRG
jgi:hypothetical protein